MFDNIKGKGSKLFWQHVGKKVYLGRGSNYAVKQLRGPAIKLRQNNCILSCKPGATYSRVGRCCTFSSFLHLQVVWGNPTVGITFFGFAVQKVISKYKKMKKKFFWKNYCLISVLCSRKKLNLKWVLSKWVDKTLLW